MKLLITETERISIMEQHSLNEKMETIQFSDLDNWSAKQMIGKSKGMSMYVLKNGTYHKIDAPPEKRITPRWHTQHLADKVVSLPDNVATEINIMLEKARKLEQEAKGVRQQVKDIVKNVGK